MRQVARQAPVAEWYTRQVEGLCPKGRGGSSPLGGTRGVKGFRGARCQLTCGAATLAHVVSFGAGIGFCVNRKIRTINGRLAQRQSIWFTPRGSQVQILCRPPPTTSSLQCFCLIRVRSSVTPVVVAHIKHTVSESHLQKGKCHAHPPQRDHRFLLPAGAHPRGLRW